MMRIITGKARGTRLDTLEGMNTRPTSERAKEAIFSMIQLEVPNSNVLDLFAGSGQMGLEALSRGATRATFVDKEKSAISVITRNVNKTHFENESLIVNSEFEAFLRKMEQKQEYDLVFLDPPYASDFLIKSLKCLVEYKLLSKSATVVCESGVADVFCGEDELLGKIDVVKQTKYGAAYVTIVKPRKEE